MIKKITFIMFCCWFFVTTSSFACDVCGAGANNMGIGLLTNFRSNFIRIGYFQSRFNSNLEHGVNSSDRFIQYNVSFRFAIGKTKKWNVMASLPYGYNVRSNEVTQLTEKGIADANINLNYSLLNNKKLGEKASIYLETGVGLSLPTGKFDDAIQDRNLPENFNIGRGAVGYIFQLNTVFNSGKNGVVFTNNFRINGETSTNYHYGNQLNSQLTVFRELDLKPFKLIPNVGVGFEKIAFDHYANNNNVPGTGGNGIFFSSAINIKTNKWLAGFSFSTPINDNYSENEVIAKERIVGHFSYFF